MRAGRSIALLLACACAPAPRPAARADAPATAVPAPAALPAWPPPPERPEVRFAGALGEGATEPPRAAWWRRAWWAILGVEARGAAPAALERPFGLAARSDRAFVADPDARRVLALAWPGGATREIACAGRRFATPMAVAEAPDGALYVADAGAGAVVRVERSGACRALGAGALARPAGIVAAGDRIWVVDPPAHAVVALDPDGREVARLGARGDGDGELNFPTALAATPEGTLLVVDALNFRVVELAPDGRFLGAFGEPGDGGGAFGRPKAIAVGADGRIYVSDALHDVVIVFARDHRFRFAVGGSGDGPGELTLPAGVAVAGSRLYVADSYNRRVAVYDLLAEASP